MAIILPGGFNITNSDSIDSRYTVSSAAGRLGFSAANVYEGLVVYQQDTDKLYVLIDTGSYNSESGWQLVGSDIYTGSFATTGSNIFNGTQTITGSLNISGSATQVGNTNLLGTTTISGSIIISGSTDVNNLSVKIYGDLETDGIIKFKPVSKNINSSESASYVYVSGSTNDLYFTQNNAGFSNTTRLRWLEGNMYSGLLSGGILSASIGTNTYYVSSGSGIIVNLNSSTSSVDPYPTIRYIQWNTLTNTIDSLSASYDQQFVAINSSSLIEVKGIPYTDGEFNTKIPIGVVIHQNHSSINAVQTFPSTAYGWKQRTSDFFKAFGPLKISGYTLSVSGSSTGSLILGGGTAWVDGRNYTIDPNNPSYINESSGVVTSKIYRYYQSGSEWAYDTQNGLGYATIDPSKYSNNGILTSVSTNNWTIQRVYYFPNSATRALYVYYGNAQYSNSTTALAAVNTEIFTEAPNTAANAIYVGYMLLRHNADFTNSNSYAIYQSGLFRSSGAGGSGGTTSPGGSSNQIQYNNSGVFGGVTNLLWDGSVLQVTGSITGSMVGTLSGTSSYAQSSLSSSFSNTSSYATITEQIGATFDGQGGNISSTATGYYRTTYPFTINNYYIDSSNSGSIQFDLRVNGTSIVVPGGNLPTLTSSTSSSAAITSWATSSLASNTLIQFLVTGSAPTITWSKLTLAINRI